MRAIVSICGLCGLFALLAIPGCSNVSSVGVTGGYTMSTGEIEAGITINFKETPSQSVVAALHAAGATGYGLTWGITSVTNDVQRQAITTALLAGATLTAPKL